MIQTIGGLSRFHFVAGSMYKGNSMKYGKRQFVLDENRRNTYKQLPAGGGEPSVLTTFDAERKQLMAVCITLISILLINYFNHHC